MFLNSYIHCGRKQLTEIPNFSRITNTFYDELVLNDNQITKISQNSFQGLRVKRLNLSGNKISSINSHGFLELANYLEELIIEFDSNYVH
jgi:Leucine-rich repeat (LRR) protein